MTDEELTKADCINILSLYRDWNTGQKSTTLAMIGIRTVEDDIYDARRKMLLSVMAKIERMAQK